MKNQYRIIRHGYKGLYEPQILVKGWFWDSYVGFTDWNSIRDCGFGPEFSAFIVLLEREAILNSKTLEVKETEEDLE